VVTRFSSLRALPADTAGGILPLLEPQVDRGGLALRSNSAEVDGARVIRPRDRIGAFRYYRADDRWEWSDAVAHMHGYESGTLQPTTALVLSHKHPDDAAKVALLIEAMTGHGQPFRSRHRIVDKSGRTRSVLVGGEQLREPGGQVVGSQGFYVDLSDLGEDLDVDAAIADFTEHRSQIEQAKGILMAVYGIPAEHAFDILVWRSQETNTKLRKLVGQLIVDFTSHLDMPGPIRERADHLLLTAHKRVCQPLAEQAKE
jgi:PAS domain S-box-containing protein